MRARAASQVSGSGRICTSRPSVCTVNSCWTCGSVKSDAKPHPHRLVSRSSTVIGRTAGTTSSTGDCGVRTTIGSASSGSHSRTGTSSATRPSSTSDITAAAVIGLVIEARRTIESAVIGVPEAVSATPAVASSTAGPRATRATAPGTAPSATAASRIPWRSVMGVGPYRGRQLIGAGPVEVAREGRQHVAEPPPAVGHRGPQGAVARPGLAASPSGRAHSPVMGLDIESRPSGSPHVERVWRTRSVDVDRMTAIASVHWELVFWWQGGVASAAVLGPETKAGPAPVPEEAEFFGISFAHGTAMPHLTPDGLVDGGVVLPQATDGSFWLKGSAWRPPGFDDAELFVRRLVREGVLARDPVATAALSEREPAVSERTVQRRVVTTTGLTRGAIRRIERARQAAVLIR